LNQANSDKVFSITPITRKLRDLNRGIDIHFATSGSEKLSIILSWYGHTVLVKFIDI